MEKTITIFTPVYNREKTLLRLYNSLLEQTNMDFEWLIVDDGSTDDTYNVLKNFINENRINIRYFYQENKGKHVAHNKGVRECKTELFLCVDSDDYLEKNAVEVILKEWEKIRLQENVAGIVAYRGEPNGGIIGTEFPIGITMSTLSNLYKKGKTGDTALIFKRNILDKYPFPEFEGEKFLRESVVYDEIDKNYSLLVVPQIIYVCEYLIDGLTKNARKHDEMSPKGAALYRYRKYLKSITVKEKIGYAAAYLYFSKQGDELDKAIKNIGVIRSLLVAPIAVFIGMRNKWLT